MTTYTSSASFAYLTFLLLLIFLLTLELQVDAITFENGVDPLQWQRHRRYYPPRVPDALTGHGMRYIQKPHINPVSVRQPHLNYNRMTHVGASHVGFRSQMNVADHLEGFHQPPATGWGLLKSALSYNFDDILERSGISKTLLYTSVDSWYNAFESTFKRDTIYNIGKVGGILVLYYFFPGVLSWISSTFGTF